MIERKDINGFTLERDQDGVINIQVTFDGTDEVSILSVDAFNTDIASMIDVITVSLGIGTSLADLAVDTVNFSDLEIDEIVD